MAMDSGLATGKLEGIAGLEPAFGLDAIWIDPSLRMRAETQNYTVVDPTSVIATHLTEVVRRHADELLTREEVGNLVEQLKQSAARLVEEVIPAQLKMGSCRKYSKPCSGNRCRFAISRPSSRHWGLDFAHPRSRCAGRVRSERASSHDLHPARRNTSRRQSEASRGHHGPRGRRSRQRLYRAGGRRDHGFGATQLGRRGRSSRGGCLAAAHRRRSTGHRGLLANGSRAHAADPSSAPCGGHGSRLQRTS